MFLINRKERNDRKEFAKETRIHLCETFAFFAPLRFKF